MAINLNPISRKGIVDRDNVTGYEYETHAQLFEDDEMEPIYWTAEYCRPTDKDTWEILEEHYEYILPENLDYYVEAIECSECL